MTVPTRRRTVAAAALAFVLFAGFAGSGAAEEPAFAAGARNPDTPDEILLFGRLAGAWDVDYWEIRSDGTFPEEPTPTLWTFRWILDGRAIQDHWISPAPSEPAGEEPRDHGTGLRTYDPGEDRWEVAWVSAKHPSVTTFEARPEGDGGIVMLGEHATGHWSRTTFHGVEADRFSWKLELQGLGKDPEAWTEVARLRAVRRE